ncbi:MAG: polysaccharide biosynthesis tyrosine autokinase [Bryobacterales bacterium]|nr:polysaccharide biosynthesis tyrosine autokinase [Bryobacterales bacterium]
MDRPPDSSLVPFDPAQPPAPQAVIQMHPAPPQWRQEEEVPLRLFWRVLRKRFWKIVFCFVTVFLSVLVATLKQTPVYEAAALIEIDKENPQILSFKEILNLESNSDEYLETQYRVLKSRSLADKVVRELKLFRKPEWYRKRQFLDLYRSDPPPDSLASVAHGAAQVDPENAAYRNTIENFLKDLDIRPVRRSNLVEVAFSSSDSRLAAAVTNALATSYIDRNLEVKFEATQKASEWLRGQLVGLKARLEKAEDALQDYARRNDIVFLDDKQTASNEKLRQVETEYTKAQAERIQAEAVYRSLLDGQLDAPGVLENKLVQDLSSNLNELTREYARLTQLFKPDYPQAQQLKLQIDTVQRNLESAKKTLIANKEHLYKAALEREQMLAAAVQEQRAVVAQVAERSIQYGILKREVDTNKQLYEGLLNRMREAEVSAGLKASNVRIVDAAQVPKRPVRPKVALNLFLGLFVGLGLGIGYAFLEEHLDNSVKNPDDVERLLALPTLGVIPLFAPGPKQPAVLTESARGSLTEPASDSKSHLAEAYRSLRTSILLSTNPRPRVVLTTSALAKEGKTTTTVNLALTLASLGSRVVVLDCDMRRPTCHKLLRTRPEKGVIHYLTGQATMEEITTPVPGVDNLHLVACGPIPPNPTELLSQPLAASLVRWLAEHHDFVLIDSPPVVGVTDSRILATLADSVVLVVRSHATTRQLVRRTLDDFRQIGARVIGVVLNGADVHSSDYDYYGYYSYYKSYYLEDGSKKRG